MPCYICEAEITARTVMIPSPVDVCQDCIDSIKATVQKHNEYKASLGNGVIPSLKLKYETFDKLYRFYHKSMYTNDRVGKIPEASVKREYERYLHDYANFAVDAGIMEHPSHINFIKSILDAEAKYKIDLINKAINL